MTEGTNNAIYRAPACPSPPEAQRASQSPPAVPFPPEAPPPAPRMLGPRGVTRARQLRPLRLWLRRPWGDGSIMASMQVSGVCSIWAGEGAAERTQAFCRGRRLGLWSTRTGSGAALVASPFPASGRWGGVRGGEKKGGGGGSSVGRSGHQLAGKLGIKAREERAKFGAGSAAVVS